MLAVRLIAINKNPGIRPIGIGESMRRIITKCLSWEAKDHIKAATGPLQTSGLPGAVEACYASLDKSYKEGKAILLIDATNAYNNMSRTEALRTTHELCPELYTLYKNFYDNNTRGFFGHSEISIQEGGIQGCSLASGMYDISIIPLAKIIKDTSVSQQWLADDLAGGDEPTDLHRWYDVLIKEGKRFGYYPNPEKCILIMHENQDGTSFANTKVKIQAGARYLGGQIGTDQSKDQFYTKKIEDITSKLAKLTDIARS